MIGSDELYIRSVRHCVVLFGLLLVAGFSDRFYR
jgi:hypothetical protein